MFLINELLSEDIYIIKIFFAKQVGAMPKLTENVYCIINIIRLYIFITNKNNGKRILLPYIELTF